MKTLPGKAALTALLLLSAFGCSSQLVTPNNGVVAEPLFKAEASAPIKRSGFAREQRSDAALRRAAADVFALAGVSSGDVKIKSHYGLLTLQGQLRANDPKNQLLAVLTTLRGVKGIRDELTVAPEPLLRAEAPPAAQAPPPQSWWEVPAILLAILAVLAIGVRAWRNAQRAPEPTVTAPEDNRIKAA